MISTLVLSGIIWLSILLADHNSPFTFTWPTDAKLSIFFTTIPVFPISELILVEIVLLLVNFFTKGFVAKINITEEIIKIIVWIKISSIKILAIIETKAPIPNQKIKNPLVKASIIIKSPAIISHIYQLKAIPPLNTNYYNYNIYYYKNKEVNVKKYN